MMELLNVTGLGREDNGKIRLAEVTLALTQGEVIGILGVNGAGKSTTLALLSGALAATSGSIRLMGEPLGKENRVHIGLLPETPPLYPELSVDENLDFAARLHCLRGAERFTAREQVKQACGLGEHSRKLARHLSKGYRLRVGIAQAMIHNPRVLLLDEPTAGLDPLQARDMRALISSAAADCGVVIATHDLTDIQMLCDRVIVLDAGRQVLEKSFSDMATDGVRIQLLEPPPLQALLTLDGINKVEPLADNWFQLTLDKADDNLAQQIAEQQWDLQAYIPGQDDFQALIYQMIERGIAV